MQNAAEGIFTTFKSFLKVLVNPAHKLHQSAWYEFDHRYRAIMLARIHRLTNRHEEVEEVTAIIMSKLIANEFKVLRDFRAKDSEAAFRVYLTQVTRTTALGYILAAPKTSPLDADLPIEDKRTDQEIEISYRESVELLRAALSGSQKKRFNQERDIFVYLLRRYGDFKSKEVAKIPLVDTKEHNVDIIVNRLENLVKKKRGKLRDYL